MTRRYLIPTLALTLAFAAAAGVFLLARSDNSVTICHHAGSKKTLTLVVDHNATPAHLSHGDELGSCPVSASR